MAPYLTADEAETLLEDRFGVIFTPTEGDMDAASYEIDASGPFIGTRYDSEQERAFPRSLEPDGTEGAGTVPDAILDAASLMAYRLSADDPPPVTSEGAGSVSVSYGAPKPSQAERRIARLLAPYLLKVGSRL